MCVLLCYLQAHGSQTVLKDLDLRMRFKLEQGAAHRVHEQLDVDAQLLSSLRVMDYSMMLGVHQPAAAAAAGSKGRQAGRSQLNFAEHSNAPGGSMCMVYNLQQSRNAEAGRCTDRRTAAD